MKFSILYIAAISLIGIASYVFIRPSLYDRHAIKTQTSTTFDSIIKDSTPVIIKNKIDTLPVQKDSFVKWERRLPLNDIVNFAQTLTGVPYKYASSNPEEGFDCSGFITYVFKKFGIKVPRSSIDFTNRGVEVPLQKAKRGDLILFTGTDSSSRNVGHMGIITENTDGLRFIHSSSGKANGVTISALNKYYQRRFVKVISIENGL